MAKVKRYSNFYTTMSDLCITHMSGYSFISRYQKKMIEVLRSVCNLPKRATQHYFFADRGVVDLDYKIHLMNVTSKLLFTPLRFCLSQTC